MSECVPCDLAAGAAILIKTYCNREKQDCMGLAKKFQKGNMTLRDLGEELNADKKFIGFLSEEADLDLTLKEVIK